MSGSSGARGNDRGTPDTGSRFDPRLNRDPLWSGSRRLDPLEPNIPCWVSHHSFYYLRLHLVVHIQSTQFCGMTTACIPALYREPLKALGEGLLGLSEITRLEREEGKRGVAFEEGELDDISDGSVEEEEELEDDDFPEVLDSMAFMLVQISGMRPLFAGNFGPRGPYNKIPKTKEYFDDSMGWPDRWFRREYR